jgi:hypothetical protein
MRAHFKATTAAWEVTTQKDVEALERGLKGNFWITERVQYLRVFKIPGTHLPGVCSASLEELLFTHPLPYLQQLALYSCSQQLMSRVVRAAPDLQALDLGRSKLGDSFAQVLELHSLKQLAYAGKNLNNAALTAIASLKTLTALNLSNSNVQGTGLVLLSNGSPKLKSLDIHDVPEFDSFPESGFARLRRLTCDLTAPHWDRLTHCVARLRSLTLNCNFIQSHPNAAWWSSLFASTALRELSLTRVKGLSDTSLETLSKTNPLKRLKVECDEGNTITDRGIASLVGLPLRELAIFYTSNYYAEKGITITARGLTSLQSCTRLTSLTLALDEIYGEEIGALKKGLTRLDMRFSSHLSHSSLPT